MIGRRQLIALLAIAGIGLHLLLHYFIGAEPLTSNLPLFVVLVVGGLPLLYELGSSLFRGQFATDLLAGISIIVAVILGEYLAASLVVLMLSGGEALEDYAVGRASSVLAALANRMPRIGHVRRTGTLVDLNLDQVVIGDELVIYPHEICPVDGIVIEGHGSMDESYLSGEPFLMGKVPGAQVFSGAINGEAVITISATKLPLDSRYAKITEVMRKAEASRPRLRRIADRLGAFYTPLALLIAALAWSWSKDPIVFLSVLVVATPCPLLIAIPVAIIGAISLCAKRAIIVKDAAILEQVPQCRTVILDKTGTLTYGRPKLTDIECAPDWTRAQVLKLAASLEGYSKHPLSNPILESARAEGLSLLQCTSISEKPGMGMSGQVDNCNVLISSRKKVIAALPDLQKRIPLEKTGLECVMLIDQKYAATFRFHDEPRAESDAFVGHLGPRHQISKIMIVSGDRESEVRYLADKVGITEVYAAKSPEEKVEIVRNETARAKTLFLGDGINDAPALLTATVGIAFGQGSDITTEAAGAVLLDNSLGKLDELFHISTRMRSIALQSAVGGIALSVGAMIFAAFGLISPVQGAVIQEAIDVVVVINALRVSILPKTLTDF